MTAWLRYAACALIGIASSLAQSQPASKAAAPVPLEAFFKPAELQSAKLSPSGRYLAALRGGVTERVGFLIIDLDGQDGSHFVSASPRDDVSWFEWVSDDWLIFSVNDPNYRGKSSIGSGLMSMSRDGKTSRQLITRSWANREDIQRRRVLSPDHRFLALGGRGSLEILVTEPHYTIDNQYDYSTLHSVNVVTGSTRTVPSVPRADFWLIDGDGRARVASYSSAGQTTISWLDPSTGQWVELLKSPQLDMPWIPLAAKDSTHLLVSTADAAGFDELREYDAAQRKLATQPMLQTPGYSEAIQPIYARHSDKLLGLQVTVDARTTTWLDPYMRVMQDRIDAKLPGRVNIIGCGSCLDAKRVLVRSYSDVDPGMVLLFSPETDQWRMVGRARPDIDPDRMSHMSLHRSHARDGQDLPIWITRPRHVPSEQSGPAVVLVHGGPWSRGAEWSWGAERQFLASRGYTVIEPEFRGSTGYGVKHFKAGFKQWGLTMQDDVSDALKFAVEKGWADPKRVCIMGSSYGGYAALMGLVKDPDQYRCGVAFAAVTDIRFKFDFFWNDTSDEARVYGFPEMVGDRVKDEGRFIATSPVEQAARIKAPVLLIHGEQDLRVPIQNGERMRDALRKSNKSVEWVAYPRAYHGFPLLEDELDFYRRIESFLSRHLQ